MKDADGNLNEIYNNIVNNKNENDNLNKNSKNKTKTINSTKNSSLDNKNDNINEKYSLPQQKKIDEKNKKKKINEEAHKLLKDLTPTGRKGLLINVLFQQNKGFNFIEYQKNILDLKNKLNQNKNLKF